MVDSMGECETRQSCRHDDTATTSSAYASPLHKSQTGSHSHHQPEYKVVNVKEPPKCYDSSFRCIHTAVEVVVVVSLICATSEIVLGLWVLNVLSRTSFHTSSSKYVTIGVGIFIAQLVRIYSLVNWMQSSKQELTKAYSATTLCTVVSILVLLPVCCLVLFVAVIVFEFVVFHNRPQIEVLEAFLLVASLDLVFSVFYGSLVACCFQNRLQKRQIYLKSSQMSRTPPPPPPRLNPPGYNHHHYVQHPVPPTMTTSTPTPFSSADKEKYYHYHHDHHHDHMDQFDHHPLHRSCFYDQHQNTMVAFV